jgi:Fic family protein
MDLDRFKNSPIGHLEPVTVLDGARTYEHFAFVPDPLPDQVGLSQATWGSVAIAAAALGRLDGGANRLPNPYLLVRPALTKEAISSSALEGTYAALEDVLGAEYLNFDDVSAETAEVRNYVLASELGLELIKRLPICLRLVRDVHGRLMQGARGDYAEAGGFRTRQNWIGPRRGTPITESLFVPPPAGEILEQGLDDWEAWVNRNNGIPEIVKAALGHYQFETLHPFIDGNGRIGRMLVTLTFIETGELRVPLLNLSPYFEERRNEYVDLLRTVSENGNFEPWIAFFARAVQVQSERALQKADRLIGARNDILAGLHISKKRGVALRVAEDLIEIPIVTAARAAERYAVSFQAANSAVADLVERGVLREITGRPYARLFAAPSILDVIAE